MNIQLQNICALAHEISKFRKLLKKYNGESSYIKKKVLSFNEKATTDLNAFLSLCEENYSWVARLESGLQTHNPDSILESNTVKNLENRAKDLLSLVRSQFNMFEKNTRKKCNTDVVGVILNPGSYVPVTKDGKSTYYDNNDQDCIILLADDSSVRSHGITSLGCYKNKCYDVPPKVCREFGLSSPAKCYVAYHA